METVEVRCLLFDVRTARGLTQQELECLTGISAKTISAYENNRQTMNVITAVKFALALNCALDSLFEYRRT